MSPSAHHTQIHQDPTFGYDPWMNINTNSQQVAEHHEKAIAAGRLYNGEDTLKEDVYQFQVGLDYYGSYVDNYGGYPETIAWTKVHAPGAFTLSYTIFGNPALCADVEPGAMAPSSLPHWLDNVAWKDAQGYAWVYTSAGNWDAVDPFIGNRKVIRIGAHYGFGPHVCAPNVCGYRAVDWTQWDDKGPNGENCDRLIGRYLPTPQTPTPPSIAGDNAMITATTKQDGSVEVFVEAQPSGAGKCGKVYHTYWKPGQGWVGAEKNVRQAQWFSLDTPGQ